MVIFMKKIFAVILIIIVSILLDFIPVKFCLKDEGIEHVFISDPKLAYKQWINVPYENGAIHLYDYESYFIEGNVPDNVLNQKDFDYIEISEHYDNYNMYVFYYDYKTYLNVSKDDSVYKIISNKWDILYPITRISFRKYYAPKGYLTIYDYDWFKVLKKIGKTVINAF